MLEYSDARWEDLKGGYGLPYDPRPALQAIEAGRQVDKAWTELWEELHHQGDVGSAAYAALVVLAWWAVARRSQDWNVYALAVTIESARLEKPENAPPVWLAEVYSQAWMGLFQIALIILPDATDEALTNSALAVLASYKRQPALARMAILGEAERRDMLAEVGWG